VIEIAAVENSNATSAHQSPSKKQQQTKNINKEAGLQELSRKQQQ
jgi:hypothetical protein